jgi:hypothetical protein
MTPQTSAVGTRTPKSGKSVKSEQDREDAASLKRFYTGWTQAGHSSQCSQSLTTAFAQEADIPAAKSDVHL